MNIKWYIFFVKICLCVYISLYINVTYQILFLNDWVCKSPVWRWKIFVKVLKTKNIVKISGLKVTSFVKGPVLRWIVIHKILFWNKKNLWRVLFWDENFWEGSVCCYACYNFKYVCYCFSMNMILNVCSCLTWPRNFAR